MRTYLSILVCACALAIPTGVQAALTLEYWSGVQDFTPYNPASPNSFNPQTLQGLRNWDFNGQSKLNSLTIPAGSQYIVKVVLRDRDSVGNGSGYTFSGDGTFNNHYGLQVFGIRFGFIPGVLEGTRDVIENGKAPSVTVWGGNNAVPSATQEDINWAIHQYGPDYLTLGNLLFGPTNQNGVTPFHQANGDILYPLANVVLNAVSTGTGVLNLTKPVVPLSEPTFGSTDGLNIYNYDNAVWGSTTFASLGFTVTPAPEPSSMLLAGLVVSSIAYRKKKQSLVTK